MDSQLEYQHQQPMSLMTIDANSRRQSAGKNGDHLLTLRILEASERKMQLIRKLLSPEEYESIVASTNIFAQDPNDGSLVNESQNQPQQNQGANSVPTRVNSGFNDEYHFRSEKNMNRNRLSRSESNLAKLSESQAPNWQENLARKRDALGFFFNDPDSLAETTVAMELRSNHSLDYARNSASISSNSNLLLNDGFKWTNLLDRLWDLLGLFGFALDNSELSQEEEKFVRSHKSLNSLPYIKQSNLLSMYERIARDCRGRHTHFFLHSPSRRIPIEDSDRGDYEFAHFSNQLIRQSSQREFETAGCLPDRTDSRRATKFKVHGLYRHDLLRYHRFVDQLLGFRNISIKRTVDLDLTETLYHIVYSDTTFRGLFYNSETKLSKLMNEIEPSFLAELIEQIDGTRRHKKLRFALDPFVDRFVSLKNSLDDTTTMEGSGKPMRPTLLARRWVNSLSGLVYLSERENLNLHGPSSAERLNTKLELALSSAGGRKSAVPESALVFIEQLRLEAAEWVRRCELRLEETLKWMAEVRRDKRRRFDSRPPIDQLLKEPQLGPMIIDLPGFIRAARRLIPRPNARRPLKPQRRRATARRWQTLSAAATESGSKQADLEAQDIVSSWQRFATSQQQRFTASPLRLVVTIQQASNIPMRIIQQQPLQQFASQRPNSPFQSSSPISFVNARDQLRPISPQPLSNYLLPPTTYVEVVFQRQQQTSSLVQGKNPSWNETLFFPVRTQSSEDVAEYRSTDSTSKPQPQQLIDEYLQLNLYDYNCFTIQDNQRVSLEPPTLALISGEYLAPSTELISSAGSKEPHARSLVASRQRVERHLLGSLRIPLTTIMTNGRIEGSFALSQPLFLDNYQLEPPEQTLSAASNSTQTNSSGRQGTHVSLFITLDPPVSMPMNLYLPVECRDGERVLEYARLWEQLLLSRQHSQSTRRNFAATKSPAAAPNQGGAGQQVAVPRGRHIRALVLRSDARYCVVSRLLGAMRPPDELPGAPTACKCRGSLSDRLQALARFVSLLSPLKYGLFQMRLLAPNLWFDSAQLINKRLGGQEERAVLLCNYFLYLGKCSAILMGDAIPDGRCVWVILFNEQSRFVDSQLQLQAGDLMKTVASANEETQPQLGGQPIERSNFLSSLPILINHNTIELWDATTGKHYSVRDQMPLVSVGSIATLENVYANLQASDDVTQTNFDIRAANCWFPLFESRSSSGNLRQLQSPASSEARDQQTLSHRRPNKRNLSTLSWRRQIIHLESLRRSIGRPNLSLLSEIGADKFNYEQFSNDESRELTTTIERIVKANLLSWRTGRPTYFNRTLSRLLAEKLALFERNHSGACKHSDPNGHISREEQSCTSNNESQWRQELANTIRGEILSAHLATPGGNLNRQIVSWPINSPFTGMRSILDSLFASGVHNADIILNSSDSVGRPVSGSSTQFLVACHVEPYPAHVMSMWLYVAAIITGPSGRSTQASSIQPQFLSP